MLTPLKQRLRRMIFLEHKPEAGEVYLKQRRVFTLPNKPGLAFVLMLGVLFIASTNYSLNLGFALTFVLGACALINNILGFRNLAYLHLSAATPQPVFAGEEAQFPLHLINRRSHPRYAICVGFHDDWQGGQLIDIAGNSRGIVQISQPAPERGWMPIKRVRLQTHFPLGLLRAWSTWLPDTQVLVYPQPELHAPPLPMTGAARQDGQGHGGNEDFAGVRAYQVGDAIKHLAWKQIARVDTEIGGQLYSKQFAGGSASDILLDYASLPGVMDVEHKLSRMTRWVLDADASGQPYAFKLGATEYVAGNGQVHRQDCLRALALFGM
jgi:uncharacterized protein (DUF58 family)